jgi:plastocyanin
MRHWTLGLIALLGLATSLSGQTNKKLRVQTANPVVIQVRAVGLKFSPSVIRVRAGSMVRVRLMNASNHPHSIAFDLPTGDKQLNQELKYGQRGTLAFRAPTQKGTYEFYCPVGDHAARGMTGQLIVQ